MSFALHRVALAAALFTVSSVAAAQTAGMTTDRDGNTGYATPEACDAAIQGGTAKFYKPQTKQKPKLRAGEASVSPMLLKDLSPNYSKGACDKGVATARGRGGVSKALQGKWIPFSPNMEVNAYKDASGKIVRVTMRQCDNHFSDLLPRPTPVAAAPAPVPAAAPAPAPVAAAPAPAPVAPAPVPVCLRHRWRPARPDRQRPDRRHRPAQRPRHQACPATGRRLPVQQALGCGSLCTVRQQPQLRERPGVQGQRPGPARHRRHRPG
jgi:hypothetical protein